MTDRITSPLVSSCELVLSEETKSSRPGSTWHLTCCLFFPHVRPFNVSTSSFDLATRGCIQRSTWSVAYGSLISYRRGFYCSFIFFTQLSGFLRTLSLRLHTSSSCLPSRPLAIIQRYGFSSSLVCLGPFYRLHSSPSLSCIYFSLHFLFSTRARVSTFLASLSATPPSSFLSGHSFFIPPLCFRRTIHHSLFFYF